MYRNYPINYLPPDNIDNLQNLFYAIKYNKDNASMNALLALSKRFDYDVTNFDQLVGGLKLKAMLMNRMN